MYLLFYHSLGAHLKTVNRVHPFAKFSTALGTKKSLATSLGSFTSSESCCLSFILNVLSRHCTSGTV